MHGKVDLELDTLWGLGVDFITILRGSHLAIGVHMDCRYIPSSWSRASDQAWPSRSIGTVVSFGQNQDIVFHKKLVTTS